MKSITKTQKMLAELLKELRITKDSAITIGLILQQDKEINSLQKGLNAI